MEWIQAINKANADLRYGDMTRYPWYRMRCEDDVLLTAVAMTEELFRMDERGFVKDRAVENNADAFFDVETFSFLPSFLEDKLDALTEDDMQEFDRLAEWMLEPEENFEQLQNLWEQEQKYRIINSPLVRN